MKRSVTRSIASIAVLLAFCATASIAFATCPPHVTRLEMVNPSQGPNIGIEPHGIWSDHMFCGTDYTYFYILPGSYLDIYEDGSGAELNGSAKVVHGDNCLSSQEDTFKFHISFYSPSDSGLNISGKNNLPSTVPFDPDVMNSWLYFVADNEDGWFVHGDDTIYINHFFGTDPNTAKYGLQVGQDANGKNLSYGMAWWFSYQNGERSGVGDFSTELDTVCVPDCPPANTRYELFNPAQGPNIGVEPHGMWAEHIFCGTNFTYFYMLPGTYLDLAANGKTAHLHGQAKVIAGGNCGDYMGRIYNFDINLISDDSAGLTIAGKNNLPSSVPFDPNVINGWQFYVSQPGGYMAFGTDTIHLEHFFGTDPNTIKYGMQIGQDANGKNLTFGMAWWNSYSYQNGTSTGMGDFSVELKLICSKPGLDVEVCPDQDVVKGYDPENWARVEAMATGGTPPYVYTWTNTQQTGPVITVKPNSTIVYTVTVTDGDNNTATASHTVTVHDIRTGWNNEKVKMCKYGYTKEVDKEDVETKLSYGYELGPCNRNYDLDGGTCGEPDFPSVEVCPDQDAVKGYDPENWVRIEATASGGTAPYTYAWTNTTQTGPVINVKPSSSTYYTVTVTDANGLTATASHKVTVYDIRVGYDNVVMCKWGNSYCVDEDDIEKKLSYGYTLGYCCWNLDLDGGACGEPDIPIVEVCPDQDAVKGYDPENWVRVTATASGGTPPYSYSWTNTNQTGPVINVKPSSTTYYTVTVTDANGLMATATHKVKVYDISMGYHKVAMCKWGNTYCVDEDDIEKKLGWGYELGYCSWHLDLDGGACGEPNFPTVEVCPDQDVVKGYDPENWARIVATVSGGTPPYSYSWTNSDSTGSVIDVMPSTTTYYTVTVTDAENMTATATHKVTVYDIRTGYNNDKVKMCKYGNSYSVEVEDVPGKLNSGYKLGNCYCGVDLETECGQPEIPEEPEGCECEDGLKEITLKYKGPSNSCVLVYTTVSNCWWPAHIKTFYDVDYGDVITIKASYGNLSKLGDYTFLKIYGECYAAVIPTNCEEESLVGEEFGSYYIGEYKVLKYKDKQYNVCEDPVYAPMLVKDPEHGTLGGDIATALSGAEETAAISAEAKANLVKRFDVVNFNTYFETQYEAADGSPEKLESGYFKYNFDAEGKEIKPAVKGSEPAALLADVYPNPFRDKVFVETHARLDEKVDIRIVDALGKEIFVQSIVGDGSVMTTEVKVPGEKGVYFVEVQSVSGKNTFKVVKQ